MTRDTFLPLKQGTSKLHAHWKWLSGNQLEQPSYFLHFLGKELTSRLSSVNSLEGQWKPRQSLYLDLMDDWTTEDIKAYVKDFTYEVEDAKGCAFQVKDIRMVPKLPSIDHESFDVHRLLNWGNARPKGASIDLSHGYQLVYWQINFY